MSVRREQWIEKRFQQPQVSIERAAEEQKLREQAAAQLAESEKAARQKFEADIQAQREAATTSFELGLSAEKEKGAFQTDLASQEAAARSTFESQLAAEKEKARETFQAQVKARRGELVDLPLRAAKRQYAITYGRQMLPRHYKALRAGAEETLQTLSGTEQESLEQELATWEKKQSDAFSSEITAWKSTELGKKEQAVKEWETSQRSAFEQDLRAWESSSRSSFEAEIQAWKSQQQASMESQFGEWREAWQPKGLAERMMEVKIPTLDLGGNLAQALGMKPIKFKGLETRIGATVFSPFGVKPYKAEVAPLAFPAGIVASGESFVYSIGQLAGLKTPRLPPTLSGGLVSSGIESIMKGQLTASEELQRISKMEPAYGAGSVIGDVLLSYGIGKVAKAGTKAVKGAAGFVYEESGLKYSHALYKAKELSLKISKHLPKSPLAAIKQSSLASEISESLSSLKHKIMPTKLMEVPAEGIVGLPTLEEEIPLGLITPEERAASAIELGKHLGKRTLETAKAVGLTPLQYEETLQPKIFAGIQLLGWTEAPRTAGLGFTVAREAAKAVAKPSALSEALAETMWIGAGAGEKWAVRAGAIPSPEDVIVQPPKEAGLQMIKGGKPFELDMARALGFSKVPFKQAAAGSFFFEKEKMPSFKDLLKGTRAEATLSQLFEAPAKTIKPILPELAMLPYAAQKLGVSEAVGLAAVLGLKPLGKAKTKQLIKQSAFTAEILTLKTKPVTLQKLKGKQVSLLKEITAPSQALKTVSLQTSIFKPPQLPRIKRKKEEEPLGKKKKMILLGKEPKKRIAGYLYPVLPEKKVPSFIGAGLTLKRGKVLSATSFLLTKGERKNVLGKQKTRHKRK